MRRANAFNSHIIARGLSEWAKNPQICPGQEEWAKGPLNIHPDKEQWGRAKARRLEEKRALAVKISLSFSPGHVN
jgi:hypothetical protein